MQADSRSHVAFYGLLMSSFATLEELDVRAHLRLLGPCRLDGRLYDLGEWPTLVLGGGVVHGEVFEVLDQAAVFSRLDPFEHCDPGDPRGSSYLRLPVALLEPALEAWVYVANHPVPGEREIACGSWTQWLGERPPPPRTPTDHR